MDVVNHANFEANYNKMLNCSMDLFCAVRRSRDLVHGSLSKTAAAITEGCQELYTNMNQARMQFYRGDKTWVATMQSTMQDSKEIRAALASLYNTAPDKAKDTLKNAMYQLTNVQQHMVQVNLYLSNYM